MLYYECFSEYEEVCIQNFSGVIICSDFNPSTFYSVILNLFLLPLLHLFTGVLFMSSSMWAVRKQSAFYSEFKLFCQSYLFLFLVQWESIKIVLQSKINQISMI